MEVSNAVFEEEYFRVLCTENVLWEKRREMGDLAQLVRHSIERDQKIGQMSRCAERSKVKSLSASVHQDTYPVDVTPSSTPLSVTLTFDGSPIAAETARVIRSIFEEISWTGMHSFNGRRAFNGR